MAIPGARHVKNRKGESSAAVDTWVTRGSTTPQRDGPEAGGLGQHSAASLRCRARNLMRVGRGLKDPRPGDNGEESDPREAEPRVRPLPGPGTEASPKAKADARRRHAPRGRPVASKASTERLKTANSGGGQANMPTRSSGPAPSPSEKSPVEKSTAERSRSDNRRSARDGPASNDRTVRRMSAAKL